MLKALFAFFISGRFIKHQYDR